MHVPNNNTVYRYNTIYISNNFVCRRNIIVQGRLGKTGYETGYLVLKGL